MACFASENRNTCHCMKVFIFFYIYVNLESCLYNFGKSTQLPRWWLFLVSLLHTLSSLNSYSWHGCCTSRRLCDKAHQRRSTVHIVGSLSWLLQIICPEPANETNNKNCLRWNAWRRGKPHSHVLHTDMSIGVQPNRNGNELRNLFHFHFPNACYVSTRSICISWFYHFLHFSSFALNLIVAVTVKASNIMISNSEYAKELK